MGWREILLEKFGPGFAGGITFGDWMRLLWENGFRVHPRCLPKAVSATLCSLGNTPLRWLEHCLYDRRIAAQPIQNWFPDLTADVRSEISDAWQRCFSEWEYPT